MSILSALLQRGLVLRDRAKPLGDLLDFGIRLYVARVFFLSGLTKIHDWESTVALFEDEYRVPVLAPWPAALLGTLGELALPVLLVVGLATRLAAIGLSVVNIVAVVSYWHVLQDAEPALAQHFSWGVLLLVTVLHGPGRLALDAWLMRRFGPAAGS